MEDIDEAIDKQREALSLHSPGHCDRPMSLNNLATTLWIIFQWTKRMEDLEEAIVLHSESLSLLPSGHLHRPIYLDNLATSLWIRFEQTGKMEDLEEAIVKIREALPLSPPGHPHRSKSLGTLATSLCTRFNRTGKMEDLEEAIMHRREALSLCPASNPGRSNSLNNLATPLLTRFLLTGKMEDIEEVIAHQREALSLCLPGHPDHSRFLNNLAASVEERFKQTGKTEDLEETIARHREALSLYPPGHSNRYVPLGNLANTLRLRFQQTGKMEDLEEAISQQREAHPLCPPGNPSRYSVLNGLSNSLWIRFNRTARMEDLGEAIAQHREALSLCPLGHSHRSMSLNNLAIALVTRFEQTGKTEDLEEAVAQHREALSLRHPGNPERFMTLLNLGDSLMSKFTQTGKMEDVEEAIMHEREALSLCPSGHPFRPRTLINLSKHLQTRFVETGKTEDLAEAMVHGAEALSLYPPGHPDRSDSLYNLAVAIIAYDLTTDDPKEEGPNLAFSFCQLAVTDNYASPLSRFKIARKWAVAAMDYHHESALQAYSHAISLLTRCLVATPTVDSQQDFLARHIGSLPYDAASCAVGAGQLDTAVELLEQGRSLLWSRMNSFRHSIEPLYAIDHTLADRFQQLTTQLEHLTTSFTSDSPNSITGSVHPLPYSSFDAKMQLHRRISQELVEIIDQIQEKEGFQDFLRPVPFKRLQAAASEGPVIIVNIGCYSSDAIILYQDKDMNSLAHIPLTGAKDDILKTLASEFKTARNQHPVNKSSIFQLLRELWQTVVGPIADKLLELGIQQKSCIWWCPTSMLCSLPLHAAGLYTPGKKNFPDIYVSSYTPTLSALIKARNPAQNPLPAPKLLAIGISDEDEFHDTQLRFNEELSRISRIPDIPVKLLDGQQAIPDMLLSELLQHSWVHIACHGHSDTQPFLSSFELNKGESLTLLQLIKAQLPNAEFAFLSACHSAAGGSLTPDENIHLAAALQFCGFQSTIGTLWSMADEDGPIIVEEFYKHMFHEGKMADYRDSARALNEATHAMRQQRVPVDRWICFVHIGA